MFGFCVVHLLLFLFLKNLIKRISWLIKCFKKVITAGVRQTYAFPSLSLSLFKNLFVWLLGFLLNFVTAPGEKKNKIMSGFIVPSNIFISIRLKNSVTFLIQRTV